MRQDPPVDFVNLIKLLAESEADFVVIGGLAVIIHGGAHFTRDADFAYKRTRENARKLAEALRPFHPRPRGLDPSLPFVWDDQAIFGSTVLTLRTDIGDIDLLGAPDGAPAYETLESRSVRVSFAGTEIKVASVGDLISMKRAAGRPKDLGHIAELESIQRLMDEEGLRFEGEASP